MDDGRTLKVNNVRLGKLDPRFTILPFQAREACIDGLVLDGSSWDRVEARRRMLKICKEGDYLSANIVGTVGEKLVTELRAHTGAVSQSARCQEGGGQEGNIKIIYIKQTAGLQNVRLRLVKPSKFDSGKY